MIRVIKKSSWSFTPKIFSAMSYLRSQNCQPKSIGIVRYSNRVFQRYCFSCLINNISYPFCTQQKSTRIYQRTSEQSFDKKQDNSSLNFNKGSGEKFIKKLQTYSQFLSKKEEKTSESKIFNTNKMQEKMIERIDQYFKIAGTNVSEISSSLENIAGQIQLMLRETEKLYLQQQNGKDSQKYRMQYEQFLKVLQKLDENYFREPSITYVEPIEVALYLLDLQTKLSAAVKLLYGSVQQSKPYFSFTPDITNDNSFSKEFTYAWDKVKVIELDQPTKKRHDLVYNLLKKSLIMVANAVVTEHTWSKWQNQLWQKVIFGLSFPVSLTDLQRAELRCYNLWRNPKLQNVMNLLDLPEKGWIQYAKKVIYPSIKSNFFLYNHTAVKSTTYQKESVQISQVQAEQTNLNIFQRTQGSGRILVLSHENLNFKVDKPKQAIERVRQMLKLNFLTINEPVQQTPTTQNQIQTVIIHMHGGGFISMSSQLMQNHTRVWANQLKVPVFSLDYRKPPNHRFPEPLQDCVAGYKFIVEKIHNYMNIRPKNIILAGDSAGGNMACALNAYLMKQRYPILPKALFLMYPATDLRIRYTPSRLHSFTDGIFLPSLLMLCQEEYLGKDPRNQFDPLASPILLTQGYINPQKLGTKQSQSWPKDWPKTVIMSGRKDPLFDDSIRLLERLTKDGIDSKMLLYKDFSHGFMSMDQVLPGCKLAIKDSIAQLKQIIQNF